MKIEPVLKYQRILPAAMALLGGVVSGCDRQGVVGSVPYTSPPQSEPKKTEEKDSSPKPDTTPPQASAKDEGDEEETPQILGGDVPAEVSQQ